LKNTSYIYSVNIIRIFLYPIAMLYNTVMFVRNKLFDVNILPSKAFNLPVISVGNLSVGGTGKTPMVEYLIRILQDKYALATLSRGYGRKSSGFILADEDSNYLRIGDEPLQYKNKFKNLEVAVDEKRVRGIQLLNNTKPDLDVVLLDDAFQHRYVKPGLSILLTDFHNLYKNDFLFPTGTLRENRSGAKRADIIVVTKTPCVLSPITKRRIEGLLKPLPHQKLFFSFIAYKPLYPAIESHNKEPQKKFSTIIMFSGIANSYPLQEHLKTKCTELIVMDFPDHHRYNTKDIEKIIQTYKDVFTSNKILITTEKDAMRLKKTALIEYFEDYPVYYVPIELRFHKEDGSEFEKQVLNYVKKNGRNHTIPSKQNHDKTQSRDRAGNRAGRID
jgi:tetraacyldisaccharide 4'-kinase